MSRNGKDDAAGEPMQFDGEPTADSANKIRKIEEVPDVMTMNFPPLDYLVDGMIARGMIILWAGIGGTGKSFLAQRMAVSVATGSNFLGRRCQLAKVLYLDYENPAFTVRARLELMASGPLPNLKVWGTWLPQQPPQIGSELLLTIAKDARPLIIVDPFRFAHGAEENDSTEMAGIMQHLRFCAAAGCAVIILHHLAKTEGSTGRGSTCIRDHSDVAFVQEMSTETDLITLKGSKNRYGDRLAVTIKPDFEEGTFEVTDSPQFTRRQDELEKLRKIITENPGSSLNSIHKLASMMKARLSKLLKENSGKLWSTAPGPYKATLYYPMDVVLGFSEPLRTTEPLSEQVVGGSSGSPLKGREPQNHYSQEPAQVGSTSRTVSEPLKDEHLCATHKWHREWFIDSTGQKHCLKCQTPN